MLKDEKKPMLTVEETKECLRRCPREEQFIRNFIDEISLEDVDKFYRYLQGEVPPELSIKNPVKLSPQKAFKVIYYLQEIMYLLPDRYERCITCNELFDADNEGSSKGGMHCDYCRRD